MPFARNCSAPFKLKMDHMMSLEQSSLLGGDYCLPSIMLKI